MKKLAPLDDAGDRPISTTNFHFTAVAGQSSSDAFDRPPLD
jgi:hypothetical protein